MASRALVEGDIERGRKAYDALSKAETSIRPKIAFWRYNPESTDWKFTVAVPAFTTDGPLRAYTLVDRVFRKSHIDLPLWRVSVLSTEDSLARWARDRVKHAQRDVVDDSVLDGAYIYKSSRSA